ncbi:DUF3099 domain-containing protein [Streptomyces sp. NPDC005794]|uniref:DUF3099 domain-containing protein n=1 Tax=Streptomyces sp. NPDC005794 TaxID=3364733 RepID=UPI0036B341DC
MYARRRRAYFLLMGGCLFLFVSAWAFVRLWSVPAAVAMCVLAMVIPPVAAIVANRKGPEDRWWDDPPPDVPRGDSRAPDTRAPDTRSPGIRPPEVPRGDSRPRPPREAPTGDPTSDAWWDELDGRKRRR